ncbi:hypothetical protein [Cohnella herbarum]|uniref:DUF5666 domain-containing protein n=1 Tax=Cohnella herbarum TaxID=2728023 RepID=A0A7Z2ZMU5_9BACL|nr:hypothetical protein [Cohnella herbarum]QJD84457.1 hypothetical protein HH215_15600 [Cohnella herbarum]
MAIKQKFIVTTIVALILLTGCGNDSTNQAAGANVDGNAQDQQQDQAAGQGMGRSPMMGADLMGKVKSIDGETITLYKSSFVPGARGGDGGQRPPNEGQDGGNNPNSGNQDGNPQPPSGEGSPPAQGEGQGRGRPGMAEMFSDETVDVQVTSATKIVKMTFENQERKETEITLADLKADDVLSVDLEDGTQNAVTITLSEGGGFGGMGGGGRRGQNQQQNSGD